MAWIDNIATSTPACPIPETLTLSGLSYHDNEDVRGCVDDLIQPDDVRVAAHSQDVNLSPDLVHDVQVLDPALVDDLHGHLLVGHHVLGHCCGRGIEGATYAHGRFSIYHGILTALTLGAVGVDVVFPPQHGRMPRKRYTFFWTLARRCAGLAMNCSHRISDNVQHWLFVVYRSCTVVFEMVMP